MGTYGPGLRALAAMSGGYAPRRDLLRPSAIIVIGRSESDDIVQRRLFQSHLAGVHILTYADLIARGEILINHIGAKRS